MEIRKDCDAIINLDPLTYNMDEFKPTFARAVIYNPNYEGILFVHNKLTDKWDLPGGKMIEEDKTIWDTAAREIYEETGYSLSSEEKESLKVINAKIKLITDDTEKEGIVVFLFDNTDKIYKTILENYIKHFKLGTYETDSASYFYMQRLAEQADLGEFACPKGDLTMIGLMSIYGAYKDPFNEYIANKLLYIDPIKISKYYK